MGLYSGGLIIGSAYFWKGLLSEFYGKSVHSRCIKDAHIRQTIPECVFNIKMSGDYTELLCM